MVDDGLVQPDQRRVRLPEPRVAGIARREWGWGGFYAPDFLFAGRDPAAALAAGLDVPGLDVAAGRSADMFASPELPPRTTDQIAERILRSLIGSGLVDHLLPEAGSPFMPQNRRLAHEAAVAPGPNRQARRRRGHRLSISGRPAARLAVPVRPRARIQPDETRGGGRRRRRRRGAARHGHGAGGATAPVRRVPPGRVTCDGRTRGGSRRAASPSTVRRPSADWLARGRGCSRTPEPVQSGRAW